MSAMAFGDGTGALESRLAAARQAKADEERRLAAAAAAVAAAKQAEVEAHADESAALVKEFIDRARRLDIQPEWTLYGTVQRTWSRPWAGMAFKPGRWRYLDRTKTACWDLGGRAPTDHEPIEIGSNYDYFLSSAGFNMVRKLSRVESPLNDTGSEEVRTVTWRPRVPHINDVVKTVWGGYDGVSREVTLADAMVEFFMNFEAK